MKMSDRTIKFIMGVIVLIAILPMHYLFDLLGYPSSVWVMELLGVM